MFFPRDPLNGEETVDKSIEDAICISVVGAHTVGGSVVMFGTMVIVCRTLVDGKL